MTQSHESEEDRLLQKITFGLFALLALGYVAFSIWALMSNIALASLVDCAVDHETVRIKVFNVMTEDAGPEDFVDTNIKTGQTYELTQVRLDEVTELPSGQFEVKITYLRGGRQRSTTISRCSD